MKSLNLHYVPTKNAAMRVANTQLKIVKASICLSSLLIAIMRVFKFATWKNKHEMFLYTDIPFHTNKLCMCVLQI